MPRTDRPFFQTARALIAGLDPACPVLIAGPTASGKSALALRIAEEQGGRIVNADALQVYDCWRILTARPDPEEEARADHLLYGHVDAAVAHSVGDWLREVAPLLQSGPRPILVGGTGLYFSALTEGLTAIPPVPAPVRAEADRLRAAGFERMLQDLDRRDPDTARALDRNNPMRVQRAWEVLQTTGRGLRSWQADTPPPLLPLEGACAVVLEMAVPDLDARIARRFDAMLDQGALDEVRDRLPGWTPDLPSSRAIGAAELVAHLRGQTDLPTARDRAVLASRQYAKRQRTWFRNRLKSWNRLQIST